MTTAYTFKGGVVITPSLSYSEIKTARKVALDLTREGYDRKNATPENVFEQYMPLALVLDAFEKDTDEGPLKVIRAVGLEAPRREWSLSINMDVLVRALIKALPGHNWTGTITAVHEDRLSGYKLVVKADDSGISVDNPQVVRQVQGSSQIVWNDSDEPAPLSGIA